MRYFYLLFVLLFSLIVSAYVLIISLDYPGNSAINTTSNDIIFGCSTASSIDNFTLYTDIGGSFGVESVDLTGSSTVEFVVNDIPNGDYIWNCLATDSSNYKEFAISNFTFTVNYVITVFGGTIANQEWVEDNSLNNVFNLSDYFTDATTYSVSGNSNINVNIDAGGFVSFTPSGNWSGTETVIFTSNGVNSNSVLLNVSEVNDAPILIENIPTQTITKNVNKNLGLNNYFSDPDDTLTYTYTSLQHISVSINGNTVTLTPETDWVGTGYIVFTAYDDETNVSSNNVTLNVVNATNESVENTAPQISSYYPLSIPSGITTGSSNLFNVTFFDIDNDQVIVSWYLNGELVSSEVAYEFLPQEGGDYNLTAYISDGVSSDFVTWIFSVADSGDVPTTIDTTLCGNNQVDAGETCLSCSSDVICGDGEVCVSGDCVLEDEGESNLGTVFIYIVSAIGFLIFSFAIISYLEKRKKINIDKDVIRKAREHIKIDNTIEGYVRKNLKNKISESVIKEKLLNVGWSLDDISKAIEHVKNESKPRTN